MVAKKSVVVSKKSFSKAHPSQKMVEIERVSDDILFKFSACYSEELELLVLLNKKELSEDQFLDKLKNIIVSRTSDKKLQRPYTYYRDNLEDSIVDISSVYYNNYLKNSPVKQRAQELLENLNLLDSHLITISEVTFERRS